MTEEAHLWLVRLTSAAERDFEDILGWTLEEFGVVQVSVYAETLSAALEALAAGPKIIGAKERNDIARGLFTLHVAGRGRKGRHFILFRTGQDNERKVIEILRILHDSMDLARHLPAAK